MSSVGQSSEKSHKLSTKEKERSFGFRCFMITVACTAGEIEREREREREGERERQSDSEEERERDRQ